MKRLIFTIFVSSFLSIFAQEEQLEVEKSELGHRMHWTGSNKTYFLQHSQDLSQWLFMPTVESGPGDYEYEVMNSSGKMFMRLKHTDTVVPNPAEHDFDGDGLTTWEEIRIGGTGTDPLIADTNGDGIRDDGADYAVLNDPDGTGLNGGLLTGLIGRWDLEEAVQDPRPSAPNFPLVYLDKTGNGHHAKALFIHETPDGIISKGTQHSFPHISQRSGHLSIDPEVIQSRNTYSVSLWLNLGKGSLATGGDGFAGIFSYSQRVPTFQSPLLFTEKLHGFWLERDGGVAKLKAGYYTYTNHLPNGAPRFPVITTFDGIEQSRPLGTYADGKWRHYVMVRESARTSIYRDGTLWAAEDHPSPSIPASPQFNQISVGRLRGNTGDFILDTQGSIYGKVDRIRLWSRALTGGEILSLYREDADRDGLWDITEVRARKWVDINGDAIEQANEYRFVANPFAPDPPETDHDNDGLPSLEEQNMTRTDIANPDTDGDGMFDGWEHEHDLDPLDPSDANEDADGDGLTNQEEFVLDTKPNVGDTDGDGIPDNQDFPPTWVSVSRELDYDFDDYGPQQPDAPKWLRTKASWPGAMPTNETLSSRIPYGQLSGRLASKQPFPSNVGNASLSTELTAEGIANTIPSPPCYHAELKHRRVYLRVATPTSSERSFKAIMHTSRTIGEAGPTEEFTVVTAIVPAGETQSAPINLTPSFQGGGSSSQEYMERVSYSIYPIKVVRPGSDSNNGKPVPVTELVIAKMGGGDLIGNGQSGIYSINDDADRFYIQIPGIPEDKKVSVSVRTGHATKTAYRDPVTAADLKFDSTEKLFTTESMILTSDQFDDSHTQNANDDSLNMLPDEQRGDRSHKAALGGVFRVDSVKIEDKVLQVNLDFPIRARKKVDVKIWRIKKKDANLPLVSLAVVNDHIKVLKERYAQIGLDVNIIGPGIKEISNAINLDDGYQIQDAGFLGTVDEEEDFLAEVATPSDADIEVFYVLNITDVSDPTEDSAVGYAYVPSRLGVFSKEIHNNIVMSRDATRYVLAHEIGHILLDDASHNYPSFHLMNAPVNTIRANDILNQKRLGVSDQTAIYSHPQVKDFN